MARRTRSRRAAGVGAVLTGVLSQLLYPGYEGRAPGLNGDLLTRTWLVTFKRSIDAEIGRSPPTASSKAGLKAQLSPCEHSERSPPGLC